MEVVGGKWVRIFKVGDGVADARVIRLNAIGHDLWVGTGRGAVRVSRGVVEFSGVPEVLRDREIWAMLVDRDGAVWFGTRHGAVRLRNGKVDTFTAADGLSDDYVSSFFDDRDGSIWIATRLGGINQLLAGPITTYTKREGLRADVVWSVFDDGRRVFVGTEGGGLATIAGGRVTP